MHNNTVCVVDDVLGRQIGFGLTRGAEAVAHGSVSVREFGSFPKLYAFIEQERMLYYVDEQGEVPLFNLGQIRTPDQRLFTAVDSVLDSRLTHFYKLVAFLNFFVKAPEISKLLELWYDIENSFFFAKTDGTIETKYSVLCPIFESSLLEVVYIGGLDRLSLNSMWVFHDQRIATMQSL